MMTEAKLSNADVADHLRKAFATGNDDVVLQTARDLVAYGETVNAVRESFAAICDAPLNEDSRAAASQLLDRYTFDSAVKHMRIDRLETINDEPKREN